MPRENGLGILFRVYLALHAVLFHGDALAQERDLHAVQKPMLVRRRDGILGIRHAHRDAQRNAFPRAVPDLIHFRYARCERDDAFPVLKLHGRSLNVPDKLPDDVIDLQNSLVRCLGSQNKPERKDIVPLRVPVDRRKFHGSRAKDPLHLIAVPFFPKLGNDVERIGFCTGRPDRIQLFGQIVCKFLCIQHAQSLSTCMTDSLIFFKAMKKNE